jgi:hypothetical protein
MSRSHADADAKKGEQVSLRSNFNADQMGYSCNKSNRSAGSLREETPSTSTGNQRDARTFKRLVHLTGRSLTVHAIRDGDRTNIKIRCGMGICELAHTQIGFLWNAGGGTSTSGGLTETRDGDGRFGAQQRPKSRGPARVTALGRERSAGRLDRAGALLTRPPLGPGHHDVDVAAATRRADEPLAPLGDGHTAPYRSAISAASGSTRWPRALHHTISRTRAAAAFPSVIGGPGLPVSGLPLSG